MAHLTDPVPVAPCAGHRGGTSRWPRHGWRP